MGSEFSQDKYDSVAVQIYQNPSWCECLLPDVGIDGSLEKYSGLNSNSELQAYFNKMVTNSPGFINNLGTKLAPLTLAPNAVGLGAFVISIILEIFFNFTAQRNDATYNMLRRVFGEEKASSVRDTMSEYLKRHEMFINDDQRLQEELQRLERQLSEYLTKLKNSLLQDGQMSTRGFKIWVNGASFHVQMLIHKVRLDNTNNVHPISAAIDAYLGDLDKLLEEYKTYKTRVTSVYTSGGGGYYGAPYNCVLQNTEKGCGFHSFELDFCALLGGQRSKYVEALINHIFTNYEQITGLKSHFLNVKNNLNTLIHQHDAFTVASAA